MSTGINRGDHPFYWDNNGVWVSELKVHLPIYPIILLISFRPLNIEVNRIEENGDVEVVVC